MAMQELSSEEADLPDSDSDKWQDQSLVMGQTLSDGTTASAQAARGPVTSARSGTEFEGSRVT